MTRSERPAQSLRAAPAPALWGEMVLATLLVAGTPIAIVWWLRSSGALSSTLLSGLLGMALSLAISQLGRLAWERHRASGDLLFSELMLWGFIRRWRAQHRLADALDMIGPLSEDDQHAAGRLSKTDRAQLLEQLVDRIETRDPYLHGHSRRVARHAWMIAKRLGLPAEEVARIRTAAALHDVGKIRTPTAILHKPDRLTDEEFEVIKRHPVDGAEMVEVLKDPTLTAMVRHHHERLDGKGYPSGLRGQEIPLGAMIIAVADTFDAITSSRPYRAASAHHKALEILNEERGERLDEAVVRAFCSHYAGRRPIVLWATAASMPESVVSWLAEGTASVASAAKVIAVAALVGGTAGSTSALASHASTQAGAARHHASGTPQVRAAASTPARAAAAASETSRTAPAARTTTRHAAARRATKRHRHGSSPRTPTVPATSPTSPSPPEAASTVSASFVAPSSSTSTPRAPTAATQSKGGAEAQAPGRHEEQAPTHGHGSEEASTGRGGGKAVSESEGTAPGRSGAEGAHGKPGGEEPAKSEAHEEPPHANEEPKQRAEEVAAQHAEETTLGTEEAKSHGHSEEAASSRPRPAPEPGRSVEAEARTHP